MPDWTYQPLRGLAGRLLGVRRSQRAALRGLATLASLLLILTGVGLFAGGAAVSVVGLTHVFVPSDLVFLNTTGDELRAANSRLLPFIAHDRAGFGGALMASAAAITLLTAWGWRRGEAWVWWSLALAAIAGFLPPVLIHSDVGYTDFWHLAPVYFGMGLTALALALSRSYLCARSPKRASTKASMMPIKE